MEPIFMVRDDHFVSIIIPVFNRISLIKETLESVKKQTYSNWELILVDDGSTDGTFEGLVEMSKEDKRFILKKRDKFPKGASTCRNIGINLAKGNYIIFLDSDDILVSTCLENRIKMFNQYPDFDFLVFSSLIFTNHPGDSDILWNVDKNTDDIQRFLDLDVPWQTTAPFWKRHSILKLGLWDDNTSAWEDMDFHIRALINDFKYKKLYEKPDYFYRVANSDKLSKNDKTIQQLYSRIRLIENIVNYFKQNNKLTAPYKDKVIKFYMWICLNFIKLKHKEGVMAVCYSLKKLGLYNFIFYYLSKAAMTINIYLFHTTFKKIIFRIVRKLWKMTIFKYYFNDLPPKNSTVKTISYVSNKIN